MKQSNSIENERVLPIIFQINSLRKRAEDFASKMKTSDEIFKEDISQFLEKEVRYQIRNGEIVIIEVKGKPRTGKSTVGLQIAESWIDDELKKIGKKDKKLLFGMRNVARDEQEYSEKMSNGELTNDVILTDEQNELEKGGENATTEQQLKSVFSDVMAGRYVHRVSVSPEQVIDDNSDIWIETVGVDSAKMITHCRVYYRINNAQNKFWQPIGYINVFVGDLIKKWEREVKKIFLKTKKTKEDEELITKMSKKDFYTLYMIKKYQKMELITRYNILRPRDLPFADAILTVINELKDLTDIMDVRKELIRSYVEGEIRKKGLRASIVGKSLTADKVYGVLKIYESYYDLKKKERKELEKCECNLEKEEWIKKRYEVLYKKLEQVISRITDEFELYVAVYKTYLEDVK